MTVQCSDQLIIDSASFALPDMHLYAVCVGDIDQPQKSSRYPLAAIPSKSKMTVCSALWRGYVAVYRLREDGTLALEQMKYPFSGTVAPDDIGEVLHGDFWLELRTSFMGDIVRVPFQNGQIMLDRGTWRFAPGVSMPA